MKKGLSILFMALFTNCLFADIDLKAPEKACNEQILIAYPRSGSNLVLATLQQLTKQPVQQRRSAKGKSFEGYNHLTATIESEKAPIYRMDGHKFEMKFLDKIDTYQNKLVLLLRNPKESITSNFQYSEEQLVDVITNNKQPFQEYIQILQAYENWAEAQESWFNWYPKSSKMVVFYEDLLENPRETFTSLLDFLEEEVSDLDHFFENFEAESNKILTSYEKKYFKKVLVPTEVMKKGVMQTVQKKKLVFNRASSRGKNTRFHTEHFSVESLKKIDDHLKDNYPVLWEKYLSRYSG